MIVALFTIMKLNEYSLNISNEDKKGSTEEFNPFEKSRSEDETIKLFKDCSFRHS
jgi:hypothetical protein